MTLALILLVAAAHAQSVRAIADSAFRSVVLITMKDSTGRPVSRASGFFIRDDLVVTNFHVIAQGSQGDVKLVGRSGTYAIAGMASVDQANDLAVLKVVGITAPPLRLAPDTDARVGDKIYAVGNPLGFEGTFSDGIISGIRQSGSRRLLQITAPISSGSSGGPILNERGLVVGVTVASFSQGQNINFAVAASELSPILAKAGRPIPLPDMARIAKAAGDVVVATKNYRAALERVLGIYRHDLARREELTSLRNDLFQRGVINRREFNEGEQALKDARKNVEETEQAIEGTERLLKEAEEALEIARSGPVPRIEAPK